MEPPDAGSALGSSDALFGLVYAELRDVAARVMARERRGHTLQPTALVNEVYLKFRRQAESPGGDPGTFLAMASRAMRQVLIDHARRRGALRRRGDRVDVDLEAIEQTGSMSLADALSIHEALEAMAGVGPQGARRARIVEMVWFGGMGLPEAAKVEGVSAETARRDWRWARVWLARRIADAR